MLATPDICSGPDLMGIDDALTVALAAVRRVSDVEAVPIGRSLSRVAASGVVASLDSRVVNSSSTFMTEFEVPPLRSGGCFATR